MVCFPHRKTYLESTVKILVGLSECCIDSLICQWLAARGPLSIRLSVFCSLSWLAESAMSIQVKGQQWLAGWPRGPPPPGELLLTILLWWGFKRRHPEYVSSFASCRHINFYSTSLQWIISGLGLRVCGVLEVWVFWALVLVIWGPGHLWETQFPWNPPSLQP